MCMHFHWVHYCYWEWVGIYTALFDTAKQLSKVIISIYSPTGNIFPYCYSFFTAILDIFHLFHFSYPVGGIVVAHYGFNFYLLNYEK